MIGPVKGLAHHPVCVCASVGERGRTRVAPCDRLKGHTTSATSTPSCTRFRASVVAFPLRRVGAKNRCTRVLDTGVSRARYYQPNTGRFWTMDTFQGNQEDPLSLHKYLYGADDPVNRIDPSGHDGDLISLSFSTSIAAGLDAVADVATTRAFQWAAFRTVTAAIAIGAVLEGDRGGSQELFHYDTLPEFQATGFPAGTWLTDRGDLPFDQALSITFQSGQRLFVYAVAIRSPSEVEPFPPLRPGVNQWRTTVYLPPVRIGIFRTLYGPNWTGPTE
ncbi:MAG: RHS repeat-associated core domain-containing protein [Verrucomicrobiota bacterium]|jgi:RHS repeat-associated protein